MTRINAGIPPAELNDKHLLAEHREIKRIPNMIRKRKAIILNIPDTFRLGTGHVKFFYDKIEYLKKRYGEIYDECKKRGFKVTDYTEAFILINPEFDDNDAIMEKCYHDWIPTQEAADLIRERIKERNTKNI
jgi:hypothetical protein